MDSRQGKQAGGLLGDSRARDYSEKLIEFNRFAEPELREAVAGLELPSGCAVLDAGCGTGETLQLLTAVVGGTGTVVGLELAAAHAAAAKRNVPDAYVVQGNILNAPLRARSFDAIWCANTLHHLRDPKLGLLALLGLARPPATIALVQSSFLPDMFFAWDARLERVVFDAVRAYYQEKYGIQEQDTAGIRSLVGLLKSVNLQRVDASTFCIERVSPLPEVAKQYLLQTIFLNTWGQKLKAYMSSEDFKALSELCDPASKNYALGRDDFHYIQTLTVVTGRLL